MSRQGLCGGGGRGGNGGAGGAGANGGSILFVSASSLGAAVVNCDASGGKAGEGGTPGAGGSPGWVIMDGAPPPINLFKAVDTEAFGRSGRQQEFRGQVAGLPGTPADPALDGPAGTVIRTVADASASALGSFIAALSPDQLAMMLSRLRFGYLTRLTFPALASDDNAPDPAVVQLKSTLDWLNTIVPHTPAGGAWDAVRLVLNDLTLKVNTRLDYYGNQFDMVPELNPDISSLAQSVDQLAKTEGWYRDLNAAVTAYATQTAQVEQSFSQIAQTFSDESDQIDAQRKTLDTLSKVDLPAAQRTVAGAFEAMNAQFASELESIAKAMSWSMTGLFSSLGSLLMFAGPEFSLGTNAGKAFAAGGALSVASNFDTSHVDAGGSSIDKGYLISKVQSVQASADSLRQAWTSSDSQGFLTPNGNSTMLIGKKQEFDQFLDQYIPDNQALRGAVDGYMDAVQEQNQLVLRYNQAVAKLLQSYADQVTTQRAKSVVEAGLESLNSPGLMQLAGLASQAYAAQMRDVLYQLYVAGRGYACLALQPCSALARLSDVADISDVNASAITVSLTELGNELRTFRTDLSEHIRASTTITLSAGQSGGGAFLLSKLKTARKVNFFVDPDLASIFGGHEELANKSDIRVTAVKAYLVGSGTAGQLIQMEIRGGGRCAVQPIDPNRPMVWFDTPTTVHTNVFQVDANGVITDRSTEDLEPTRMQWGGDNGVEKLEASLAGIYSQWTVRVATDELPLDTLTEVRLVFDVDYRGFDIA